MDKPWEEIIGKKSKDRVGMSFEWNGLVFRWEPRAASFMCSTAQGTTHFVSPPVFGLDWCIDTYPLTGAASMATFSSGEDAFAYVLGYNADR